MTRKKIRKKPTKLKERYSSKQARKRKNFERQINIKSIKNKAIE